MDTFLEEREGRHQSACPTYACVPLFHLTLRQGISSPCALFYQRCFLPWQTPGSVLAGLTAGRGRRGGRGEVVSTSLPPGSPWGALPRLYFPDIPRRRPA